MDNNQKPKYNQRKKDKATSAIDLAGKKPPSDVATEAAVLGAMLIAKDAYLAVCDILKPEMFYDPAHKIIYEAIQSLGAAQQPIDFITVINQLEKNETLEQAGGRAFIVGLTTNISSAAHIEYHTKIIMQKHLARELISFGIKVQSSALDESNDVDEVMQTTENDLFAISQNNVKKDVVQIDPVIQQAIKQMEAASQRTSGLSGLESGFRELDKLTSGWQKSDLIIIAARPAMGKTAFVLSMAKNMAVNFNIPVAIFSLEMSNIQLVNRLISNVCEIDGAKIKSGKLSPIEWQQTMSRLNALYGAPLYIDDTPSLSVFELRTKARRLRQEKKVEFIIIDYLQLMNATGMKYGSREQEVSMISRSLKQLAKELNIPIVALSQLNRSVESRSENKRPQLSDLRESGAIEQDADMVCFIHRPEYYNKSGVDAQGKDIRGLAEFIVAKHRSGSVDDVNLRFRAMYARFENWDEVGAGDFVETRSTIGGAFPPLSSSTSPLSGGTADLSPSSDQPTPF